MLNTGTELSKELRIKNANYRNGIISRTSDFESSANFLSARDRRWDQIVQPGFWNGCPAEAIGQKVQSGNSNAQEPFLTGSYRGGPKNPVFRGSRTP